MDFNKKQLFKIIYEDNDILVCFKPAGIPTQTAGLGSQDLVSLLKNYLAGDKGNKNPYLAVIHRLDQPVSGLLVFAKNKKAAGNLSKQMQEGFANKDYLALCEGIPKEPAGTLTNYIKKNPVTRLAEVISEESRQGLQNGEVYKKETGNKKEEGYKKAVLSYEVTEEYSDYSLLKIHLHTGRFHQIRAQFAFAGHPLLGDKKYGTAFSNELSESKGITSIALCAYRLILNHPSTGRQMVYEWKQEELPFRI